MLFNQRGMMTMRKMISFLLLFKHAQRTNVRRLDACMYALIVLCSRRGKDRVRVLRRTRTVLFVLNSILSNVQIKSSVTIVLRKKNQEGRLEECKKIL